MLRKNRNELHCEYKTNNIKFCLYLYKLYVYELLIYDFNETIYLHRFLNFLLSYYFIDFCYILNRQFKTDFFINLSCFNISSINL